VKTKEIHPLLAENRVFLLAGVYDCLSAKLAERTGFPSVFLTGFGASAAHLGVPDFGLLTQTEILDLARRVCRAVNIDVVVDGDTGYGSALNVIRMVEELLAMGAAGIILEDQTWPKRCGHMLGKSVVAKEEHVQKIRAAREAKGDSPFLVIARTDARAPLGLDEAIQRGKAYKQAGADVIFIEAPESVEEMQRIAEEVPGPHVANMIEGGKTPVLPLEDLHAMGYTYVGYVLTGLSAAARTLEQTYAHLLARGTSAGLEEELMSFADFTSVVGLQEMVALDEKYKAG
jgi:methylisocitrate lyase